MNESEHLLRGFALATTLIQISSLVLNAHANYSHVWICKSCRLRDRARVISNVSVFWCYKVMLYQCYRIMLHICFIIKIDVHDRSMFPFCSLEGFINKEQVENGSRYSMQGNVVGNIEIHSHLALYHYTKSVKFPSSPSRIFEQHSWNTFWKVKGAGWNPTTCTCIFVTLIYYFYKNSYC